MNALRGIAAWLMILGLISATASAIDHMVSTVGHARAIQEISP